ncbi:MAG: hypothetical protein J5I98_27005 [Phaeodactylibacter sp.]|nr:hypothetical protein [Phaeodactylibacter sp.]
MAGQVVHFANRCSPFAGSFRFPTVRRQPSADSPPSAGSLTATLYGGIRCDMDSSAIARAILRELQHGRTSEITRMENSL